MQLGFVSAILADLGLEEVVETAAREGYDCVELLCWPKGKAERRYAGVTHVDVTSFDASDARRVRDVVDAAGISISALGYYPNPLVADEDESKIYVDHIKKVIRAAALLGVGTVNTFVGRDPSRSVEAAALYRRVADWTSRPITTCASPSRIAPCCSRMTNGRAARIWRSVQPSGGACSRSFPACISG